MNILITGADGFIGRNVCEAIRNIPGARIIPFKRENTIEDLERFLKKVDVIYHLAAVMIPDDKQEFTTININLTKKITEILQKLNRKPIIIFSSSIHASLDTPYGKSKKESEEILHSYASQSGNKRVFIYRLTNVFGKWAKPNSHSVVATFCYNISRGMDIKVNDPSKEITFIYIDDVVNTFIKYLNNPRESSKKMFYDISPTYKITLKELANQIYDFNLHPNNYKDLNSLSPFLKALFETYLSYKD